MTKPPRQYWWMILTMAWTAAWSQTARFYDSNEAILAEYERLHPPRVP
jgi:hypothetical protein